jgi:hypothetical protein
MKRADNRPAFPSPPATVEIAPTPQEEMPALSVVEIELGVLDDLVTFVGRDPRTGRPRIKIEMARADASPEWGIWISEWLHARQFGALQLVTEIHS